MNTNIKNSIELDEEIKNIELTFNYENPMDMPFSGKRAINLKKKDGSSLSLKRQFLGNWIDTLIETNGVYFLDFDFSKFDNYNMHYLDHENGKLMEMNMPPFVNIGEDPKREFLDKLIFDLTLFQSGEPIVVYGKSSFEEALKQLSELYYEYADEVDSILDRLVDMEQVFTEQWYWDTRFRGNTIKTIYPVLFPGQICKTQITSNSLAMYKIYEAIQSIYFQLPITMGATKMAA